MFCILNIVYNPLIHKVFGTYFLSATDWLYVISSMIIFFVVRESYKLFFQRSDKIRNIG